MKLKNLATFIKRVLIRRNIIKLESLHQFHLDTNKAKINNINYLKSKYKNLLQEDEISSSEFQIYSQNGEDGVILYILNEILEAKKTKCLEIGSGGNSSNILNLNLNFGFESYFLDGSREAFESFKNITKNNIYKDTKTGKSHYIEMFLTRENIPELDKRVNLKSLLICSLDIDGVDYYIFEKLLDYEIPIIICEYNSFFSISNKYAVPYVDNFSRYEYHNSSLVFGASLDALQYVASKKNYSLIYCENNGVNAFFVNNNYLSDKLEPKTPSEVYKKNFNYSHISHENFLTDDIKSLLVSVDNL